MELLLGSHVREHGNRVGRLAGFELEPATRTIRRIIFSADGDLGPHALTRPLAAIGHVHANGEIELRVDHDAPLPATADVVLLSGATRIRAGDRQAGRLIGVELNPGDRSLLKVLARTHWWSRREPLDARGLDCSVPGEIRAQSGQGTQAA
jgi:hypothetical protein